MYFKRKNKSQPVRLAKKEENCYFDFLNGLLKNPIFWLFLIFSIFFILCIIFAYNNATAEKVYNLANITIR